MAIILQELSIDDAGVELAIADQIGMSLPSRAGISYPLLPGFTMLRTITRAITTSFNFGWLAFGCFAAEEAGWFEFKEQTLTHSPPPPPPRA